MFLSSFHSFLSLSLIQGQLLANRPLKAYLEIPVLLLVVVVVGVVIVVFLVMSIKTTTFMFTVLSVPPVRTTPTTQPTTPPGRLCSFPLFPENNVHF